MLVPISFIGFHLNVAEIKLKNIRCLSSEQNYNFFYTTHNINEIRVRSETCKCYNYLFCWPCRRPQVDRLFNYSLSENNMLVWPCLKINIYIGR